MTIYQWLARKLAAFLSRRVVDYSISTSTFERLAQTLAPGDVLLVEGDTRICRPEGLAPEDLVRMTAYATARLGHQYDLRNVVDLARYLLPTPPVPTRYRRRLLAFGSGDPTRAICSTFIAQTFQCIRYPILPEVSVQLSRDPRGIRYQREIFHIRHHSLFVPRDFDASPYFRIVKPTLAEGFDFRNIRWAQTEHA